MQANKLSNIDLDEVSLVDQGANPDAHIRLFKRQEGPEPDASTHENESLMKRIVAAVKAAFGVSEPVEKDAQTFQDNQNRDAIRDLASETYDMTYNLADSLTGILFDDTLDAAAKQNMMGTSVTQFTTAITAAIPSWAAGTSAKGAESISKSADADAAFDAFWKRISKQNTSQTDNAPPGAEPEPTPSITKQEGVIDTMQIDKSKMTPEEAAALADFEKRYGIADPEPPANAEPQGTPPEDVAKKDTANDTDDAPDANVNPEVRKALDGFKSTIQKMSEANEALEKKLEMRDLQDIAKKYETLGKKPDELAEKLYGFKKAGGTAYDDYIAVLDESLTISKNGIFREIGSNASGTPGAAEAQAIAKAKEIAKQNNAPVTPDEIVKAFTADPELLKSYDAEYMGGEQK